MVSDEDDDGEETQPLPGPDVAAEADTAEDPVPQEDDDLETPSNRPTTTLYSDGYAATVTGEAPLPEDVGAAWEAARRHRNRRRLLIASLVAAIVALSSLAVVLVVRDEGGGESPPPTSAVSADTTAPVVPGSSPSGG